jgi:hypothetical protein
MRARLVLGFAMALALGCGSNKYAPVSGKVTLNGKPLPKAHVMFSPVGKPGSIEAGEGSAGTTNEKGEFTLKSSTGKNGALVGDHQVSISALEAQVGDRDTRPPRGGPPMTDKVPSRYNSKSELTFSVPSGGSNKADFDLKSP